MAKSFDEKDRENKVYLMERDLNISYNNKIYFKGKLGHTSIVMIPDNQEDFFTENGELKEELKKEFPDLPEPEKFGENIYGWIVGGFKGEKEKGEVEGDLVVRFNDNADKEVFNKINGVKNNTQLTGEIISEISYSNKNDTKLIKNIVEKTLNYNNSSKYEKYFLIPINLKWYDEELQEESYIKCGYNCNSFSNTILRNVGIKDPFRKSDIFRLKIGKGSKFPLKEK